MSRPIFRFFFLSLIVLLAACSVKRLEPPTYEGRDPGELLAGKEGITSLKSTFSIEFEREGGALRGDGVLWITPETLELRVYSLGFLIAEVEADREKIRSSPSMDRPKLALLVDGLRNSFLWWSLKGYAISDEGDVYSVSNSWRRVLIDKRTFLPRSQSVDLEGGKELDIRYEAPDLLGDSWSPSQMRIALGRYSVTLKIKTLALMPQ